MGIIVRQSAKASIASYIGAFIGYLNVVFITPYCLPPEIVGLNRVLVDMGMYLAFIAQLGVTSGVVKYYPKFKNREHQLLFLSVIIPFIGFVIFSVAFLLLRGVMINYFAKNSSTINHYINLVLPLTFFNNLPLLETLFFIKEELGVRLNSIRISSIEKYLLITFF